MCWMCSLTAFGGLHFVHTLEHQFCVKYHQVMCVCSIYSLPSLTIWALRDENQGVWVAAQKEGGGWPRRRRVLHASRNL
jgi:hypothetical protein